MNLPKPVLALLVLLLPAVVFAQDAAKLPLIDSLAIKVAYQGDLKGLTSELTAPYTEQLYKARAIFRWITENISYDYKNYNKYFYKDLDPPTYRCKDGENCEAKRIVWEMKYLDKVLRKKKAVCQGYAMLFKKMCGLAGVESEVIPGYTRAADYQVGGTGALDHAWNVVKIDSTWYLLDATWAAGGCAANEDGKLLFFKKNFNNYYWLTPPVDFARNHFPQNDKWILIPGYTKENFKANPYYAADEISNLTLLAPAAGIVAAKKGDTIRFKLVYTGYFKDLQINSNIFHNPNIWALDEASGTKRVAKVDSMAVKKQQYIQYTQNGNIYEFEYIVTNNALYYLDILFDRQRIMRFKVVARK